MSDTRIGKKPFYVTMTDKFMSGWGMAEGKTNKYIIGASSYDEALRAERNARQRNEMKYVNLTSRRPRYNKKHVLVSYVDFETLGDIWKK